MRNPLKVANKKIKNMENFNELFQSAKSTADRRNVVFNNLISETKKMLPEYCEAIKNLGYNSFLFDQPIQVVAGQKEVRDMNGETSFPVLIYSDGTISTCEWEFDGEEQVASSVQSFSIEEIKFTKIGIVSLVKQMNYKLKVMIDKRESQNKTAEELLKK